MDSLISLVARNWVSIIGKWLPCFFECLVIKLLIERTKKSLLFFMEQRYSSLHKIGDTFWCSKKVFKKPKVFTISKKLTWKSVSALSFTLNEICICRVRQWFLEPLCACGVPFSVSYASGWESFCERSLSSSWFLLKSREVPGTFLHWSTKCDFRRDSPKLESTPNIRLSVLQ